VNIFKHFSKVLFVLAILAVSCKGKNTTTNQQSATQQRQQALSVEAMIAQTTSLSSDIEIPGTIMAYESTEIHPEVSGRVTVLNVREGASVGKGALLAKLYDGDLQAQLRKIEVQLKIAEQTENRQAELLKIQGISRQDYDLSLLQVNNLKADLEIIRTAISKTEIRAPFGGKLGLKNISPGAYITPATIITTIGQVNNLKLQFNVPEKYGSELRNGQSVQFNVDGSDKNYTANVMATEVHVEENTRSLAVRAVVRNSDNELIPGGFAKVKIILGRSENAIMIPNSSVLPQGRKKLTYVYQGGKAVQTEITTGVRDSTNIQVLTGIGAGDTIITTGLLFLRPGLDVKISSITNRTGQVANVQSKQ
jgi:membrane fusion protein, multidrug efflux system